MHNISKLATLIGCLFLSLVFSADEAIDYPSVDNNPPYNLVSQLPYRLAQHKISYGEDESQYGLLWLTDESHQNDTLVLLIHGGCWLTPYDIQHTFPMATAISQAGYNVWSLEYRRTGDSGGGWPITYQDIKAGVSAVDQLQVHGVSPKQIIVVGHSAGGHLALLVARDKAKLISEHINLTAVGLAAISDLATYSKGDNGCQKAGMQFMGGELENMREAYREANPINHVISAPIVLMHGEKDPIVSIEQSRQFTAAELTRIEIKDAGHFDWVHPGSPAFVRLLDQLRLLSAEKKE